MDSLVTFLLDNVKELLVYHEKLISGAKNELEQLRDQLNTMKATLESASRNQNKSEIFKVWEGQIREVLYEVEDTIDTCIIQMATDRAGSSFGWGIRKKVSLAKQVKSLRTDKVAPLFAVVIKDFQNMSGGASGGTGAGQSVEDKRRKVPRIDNVVGFEDEIEAVIKILSEDSDKFDVVSIVGIGGLGKTTVAWKVYNDPRIQHEFSIVIWVTISQQLNKKELFLSILKKLIPQDLSSKPVEELGNMVKDELMTGKYLIFMDDVWSDEDWDAIKQVLPSSNNKGKVLITTRDDTVSAHANPHREPYRLRFLREDESWGLLQLEVYGSTDVVKGELAKVGKIIANECGGLPLSIIIVGGILLDKVAIARGSSSRLKEEWEGVAENVKGSIIRDDRQGRMKNLIELSYARLPYNMRECFLYLGVFPEDIEIPTWKIIQLWVSEGFIHQKSGKTLEDVAEENLNYLISRNLVMVASNKLDDKVKTCRVHDSIREFCRNLSKEQNFFQEIKVTKQVFEPLEEGVEPRRLCISSSYVHDFFLTKQKFPKVRSFLCFPNDPIILENKDVESVAEAFRLLRVFDADKIIFPTFPENIKSLLHLRFLTLTGDDFQILPNAITKLWNLQTLIVNTSSRTLTVNADLWQLFLLRHFKANARVILNENMTGNGGKNLQSFSMLSPESCTVSVFKEAKALTTLGIQGDLSILISSKCLGTLPLVSKLKLIHDVYPRPPVSRNGLPSLPEMFPPGITILALSKTFLEWTNMSILGKLHKLKVLKLKENAFKGRSWKADDGGFGCLEFLYIASTDLVYWEVSNGTLSELKSLVLKSCEKLDKVPSGLAKTLELLKMENITKSAVESGQKIEKEIENSKRGGFKLVIAPADLSKLK